eukprot:869895-Rhodomonas_salina.1
MLDKVNEAIYEGVYPGWESSRVSKDGEQLEPLPILCKTGLVKSRRQKAASAIGLHILVSFYNNLNHVDLQSSV